MGKSSEECSHPWSPAIGASGVKTICRLAVARGCATSKRLYITDQAAMFPLMQQNIQLNKLEEKVTPEVLNWGDPLPEALPCTPDIILAADCVYFEPAFPLLLKTLLDLVGHQSTVYFCFKKRRRADMHFIKAARKLFVVDEVHDDPDEELYKRDNIFL